MTIFDVWSDDIGQIRFVPAEDLFVCDSDAPLGFCKHLHRLKAGSAEEAAMQYKIIREIRANYRYSLAELIAQMPGGLPEVKGLRRMYIW